MAIGKKKKKRLQRDQENTPIGRQSEYFYIENSTEIIFKSLRVQQNWMWNIKLTYKNQSHFLYSNNKKASPKT